MLAAVISNAHVNALASVFSARSCDSNQALDSKQGIKGLEYVRKKNSEKYGRLTDEYGKLEARIEELVKAEAATFETSKSATMKTANAIEAALKRTRYEIGNVKRRMRDIKADMRGLLTTVDIVQSVKMGFKKAA